MSVNQYLVNLRLLYLIYLSDDENYITLVPTADYTSTHTYINAGFIDVSIAYIKD